jgi:hypothetical protein
MEVTGPTSIWEQLVLLRQFTARTGVLHEAQIQHLKIWPRLLFPNTKARTSVDQEGRKVNIEVLSVTGRAPKAILPKPAETLNEWVKALLGASWEVAVRFPITKGRVKEQVFPATAEPESQLDQTLKNLCGVDPSKVGTGT